MCHAPSKPPRMSHKALQATPWEGPLQLQGSDHQRRLWSPPQRLTRAGRVSDNEVSQYLVAGFAGIRILVVLVLSCHYWGVFTTCTTVSSESALTFVVADPLKLWRFRSSYRRPHLGLQGYSRNYRTVSQNLQTSHWKGSLSTAADTNKLQATSTSVLEYPQIQ